MEHDIQNRRLGVCVSMRSSLMSRFRRMPSNPFPHLRKNVYEVRSIGLLKKAMGWTQSACIEGEYLEEYEHLTDLNDRRKRDAEVIAHACSNAKPGHMLEIGTASGQTTALMAINSPSSTVHTVNIPPESIDSGGTLTTYAPSRDEIGRYYRSLGLRNINQIFANTAHMQLEHGPISVAFIDGCHDKRFVYNDTLMAMSQAEPGTIILWHDFAPPLSCKHHWIAEVCAGVEKLYRTGKLRGPTFHLEDSWVGMYVCSK